jgi:hypothetical protein
MLPSLFAELKDALRYELCPCVYKSSFPSVANVIGAGRCTIINVWSRSVKNDSNSRSDTYCHRYNKFDLDLAVILLYFVCLFFFLWFCDLVLWLCVCVCAYDYDT